MLHSYGGVHAEKNTQTKKEKKGGLGGGGGGGRKGDTQVGTKNSNSTLPTSPKRYKASPIRSNPRPHPHPPLGKSNRALTPTAIPRNLVNNKSHNNFPPPSLPPHFFTGVFSTHPPLPPSSLLLLPSSDPSPNGVRRGPRDGGARPLGALLVRVPPGLPGAEGQARRRPQDGQHSPRPRRGQVQPVLVLLPPATQGDNLHRDLLLPGPPLRRHLLQPRHRHLRVGVGPVLPLLPLRAGRLPPRGHPPPRGASRRPHRRPPGPDPPRRRLRRRRAHAGHRLPLGRPRRRHHHQRVPGLPRPGPQQEGRPRQPLRGRAGELPPDAVRGRVLRRGVCHRGHLPRAQAGGRVRRGVPGADARGHVRVVRVGDDDRGLRRGGPGARGGGAGDRERGRAPRPEAAGRGGRGGEACGLRGGGGEGPGAAPRGAVVDEAQDGEGGVLEEPPARDPSYAAGDRAARGGRRPRDALPHGGAPQQGRGARHLHPHAHDPLQEALQRGRQGSQGHGSLSRRRRERQRELVDGRGYDLVMRGKRDYRGKPFLFRFAFLGSRALWVSVGTGESGGV